MHKILLVAKKIPPEHTGAGLRASRLADRLRREYHHEFLYLSQQDAKYSMNRGESYHNVLKVKEDGIYLPFYLLYSFVACWIYLIKHHKQIELIHIISLTVFARMLALNNILFFRKPMIMEVTLYGFDDPFSLLYSSKKNCLLAPITRLLLKCMKRIIVPSEASLRSAEECGISKKRIWIRPHPVDEKIFGRLEFRKSVSIKKKLNLKEKVILLNIGEICERKNQFFLLKVLEQINDPDIRLLFVGPYQNKEYFDSLQAYSVKHRLKVTFLGKRDDVNELMIAADVFVFSSRAEGFPNVIAESLVSGLPIVTTYLEPLEGYMKQNFTTMMDNEKEDEQLILKYARAVKEQLALSKDKGKIRRFGVGTFSSSIIDRYYNQIYGEIT